MYWWARVLGIVGLFFIFLAGAQWLIDTSNAVDMPDQNMADYLGDIGFQAFVFFGVLVGVNSIWLRSNARDGIKDPKALPIKLELFRTSKGYTYGAIGIAVITFLLYAVLW